METQTLLIIAILVLLGVVVFLLFRRERGGPDNQSMVLLQNQISDLNKLLNERLKENRESQERTIQGIHSQISNFATGITKMSETLKLVDDSVKDVSSFQKIFRTPKLRGRWGELALEHILAQYFPKDMFERQYYFKSGEPVDAVLKLPDGKLLPIDAKFPFEDFERMIELDNPQEREIAKKSFTIGVKKEIDDIAKKYILPSEGTVNHAIMYIPAEAVFFEIINSLPDVINYAQSKKVVLASPNVFYITLQSIQHWARDMQIGRQTQDIMKRMNRIISDAQKLSTSFNKLGKHLSDARSSYEDSDKRLGLLVERSEKLIELEGPTTNNESAAVNRPSLDDE